MQPLLTSRYLNLNIATETAAADAAADSAASDVLLRLQQ